MASLDDLVREADEGLFDDALWHRIQLGDGLVGHLASGVHGALCHGVIAKLRDRFVELGIAGFTEDAGVRLKAATPE